MKNELEYMLDVIEEITWNETGFKIDDDGNRVKITSSILEEIMGFEKVEFRSMLSELKQRKLISNSPYFTGPNSGWFATVKGHHAALYGRSF